jgi:hypothetical protein
MKEKDLIGYRLGLRTAKLLEFFGKPVIRTRNMIEDAYNIRSKFAHGEAINLKTENAIRKEYGNAVDFMKELLDCLRLCLIIYLSLNATEEPRTTEKQQSTESEKKKQYVTLDQMKRELIDLIDDSLLDGNKLKELEQTLQEARELVA